MQHYHDLLLNSAASLGIYKYFILFFLAIIEGPMVMVFSGFLVKLGYLNFLGAYFSLMLGDLLGDFGWYGLGYLGAKKMIMKYGRFVSLTPARVEKIEAIFKEHQRKIIFISKITMGFGFALATLITAGMSHISLKRFGLFNFLGGLVWTAMLMLLGFILGHTYLSVGVGFRVIFIISIVITLSVAFFGFGRFMRHHFFNE